MKVLVIGGSGFIGTWLLEELIKEKHEVRIFDKNPSALYAGLATLGDVRDPQGLNDALRGVEVVFNLAAEHRDNVLPQSLYYDVNVQGAKNIVQAAENNGVKRIIFTSTVAVYGLQKADPDEESPAEPFNEYGRSKLEAENIFDAWRKKEQERSLVIVRPVVIFGEGNKGNVYTLIRQIASNRFIMVGSGENKKSMGYVGNIVRFLVRSMRFGPGKHVFNYADKPDVAVDELVDYIMAEMGISKPYLRVPYVLGLAGGYVFDAVSGLTGRRFSVSSIRIRKFCANTTVSVRALQSTGFSAPYSIREGLTRMIKSMKIP